MRRGSARLRRHLAGGGGSGARCRRGPAMPHYQAWEEFTRAAEKLYLADPMKVGRGPGAGPRGLAGGQRDGRASAARSRPR